MKVFYARVSTEEQNEARQIVQAKQVNADKIFIDKKTGRNAERQELKKMLAFVRENDVVIVESISRLARSTKDLLNIAEELKQKNVDFISLKENIDTSTPQGKFMLTVFSAMAELEVESIRQRQLEGIAIAKANGKYKGRTPIRIDEVRFDNICSDWVAGNITAVEAQKRLNMTPATFYRKVKERGYKKN